MTKQTEFFKAFDRRVRVQVHTFAPARILSFDKIKQTASIEVLFQSRDEEGNLESYPPIEGVPVLGMRYEVDAFTDVTINGLTADEVNVNGSNGTLKTREPLVMTPSFKPNDIVFVAFAERALDNLQVRPFDPDSYRMHDLVDAVIIGGYQLT